MQIPFRASAGPSLGVEWELALVDAESGDLVSRAEEVFERLDAAEPPHRVHRELLLNTVELVSDVCQTTAQAMADLDDSMRRVRQVPKNAVSVCPERDIWRVSHNRPQTQTHSRPISIRRLLNSNSDRL